MLLSLIKLGHKTNSSKTTSLKGLACRMLTENQCSMILSGQVILYSTNQLSGSTAYEQHKPL